MKRLSVFIVIVFIATSAAAQEKLLELWKFAKENNRSVAAERYEMKALEQELKARGLLPDPALEVEVMSIAEKSASLKDFSVAVSQTIPGSGKLALEKKKSRLRLELQEIVIRQKEIDLGAGLSEAFWNEQALRRLLVVNSERLAGMSAVRQAALSLNASGKAGIADIMRIEEETTMIEADEKDLAAELEIARARLRVLAGGEFPLSVLDNVEFIKASDVPAYESLLPLVDSSPSILAVMKKVEISTIGEESALKAKRPDYMVKGQYRPNDTQMNGDGTFAVMFGITLPFFKTKSRYNPLIEKAKFERLGSEELAGYEKIRSAGELRTILAEMNREKELAGLFGKLEIQAGAAFKSALSDYVSGRGDLTALLETLNGTFDAKGSRIKAAAAYSDKKVQLDCCLGLFGASSESKE